MHLLRNYFDIQKQIHDYFGYREDWAVIPMRDECESYWFIDQKDDGSGVVVHSPNSLTLESIEDGSELYGHDIYTQRHLPKWVYRGAEYTMVCVDTHTDGNKFLMVFDNDREQDDPKLKAAYQESWGSMV